MFTELRLHSKQRSLTLCTIRCDWASLYGTTLTELLVLTDFGVCLLVELVCYLFSDGERGKDWSSDLEDAEVYLHTLLSLSGSKRAMYVHLQRNFTDDTWGRQWAQSHIYIYLTNIIHSRATSSHHCNVSSYSILTTILYPQVLGLPKRTILEWVWIPLHRFTPATGDTELQSPSHPRKYL